MNESVGFSNLEIHEMTDQYHQGNDFKPPTMSSNEHRHQHHGDAGASSNQQPPFNPILSHQGQLSLGNSVVPDLMRVYESLTQSSTPQMDLAAPAQPTQHAYHQYPLSHQYQQPQSQQTYSQSQYPLAAEKQMPDVSYSASGRSLRKRSPSQSSSTSETGSQPSSKSRKKGNSDGRWSKRFTWPDELHRDFVSAVFDVGLKHSSPSAILSQMPEHEGITTERIKSHLQKYRVHRAKSKSEFMGSYAASLNKFRSMGGTGGSQSLAGGEVAAHATYATMKEEEDEMGVPSLTSSSGHSFAQSSGDSSHQGGTLVLPKLTEEEKLSPIGASMGYLMGLYFSLNQQLMAQRAASSASGVAPMAQNLVANAEAIQFGSNIPVPPFQEHPAPGAQQPVSSHATTSMSAVRTNLEESHLMKRDMQSSREIQNKMRALKQHELNKVQLSTSGSGLEGPPQTHDADFQEDGKPRGMEEGDESYQGAGETAESGNAQGGKDGRSRGMSLGHPDDFWTNDEQLFEFLMNP